ncbi:structural maintenance of chromosomes protein 6 isoform X1 [Acipenser oxyrinchus oxyrinchus]|uniref:Structural maintenance of chromosomes protein 6 n=1 Tax=Acipenser oxyrinchus oxyrinchus TaxID=40147 RepID=A0AAD8GC83_ACIOX|nr:structural maintenance of chromosomes protein 6 isoform X1 [Acipenser oxyrinchus oxyrinchus]
MSKRKDHTPSTRPQKRTRTEAAEDTDEESNDNISQFMPEASQNSPLSSGEVGIIESISLKNFMCHSLLGPFKFGSNVNFVVGNNGSGKSAVLTALIVGLGGKALATNRGSSLKGFVKEGQSSADVSITLRNRGPDAFKPDVYGEAIIVDQRISSDGVRSYKLKSKIGHVVSMKKEELISILDHFNIQVDNPVSILTQEMSKHFLQSKGEGDKYKFFMKATQLEQMKEDYTYIMETKTVTLQKVDKHDESLEDLKRQCSEKEDRYNSLASLDEMQNKLEELKHQMAWAVVSEIEKQVQPSRDRIKAEENSTVKFDQKVEEWKGKVVDAEKRYKEIYDQLEGITEKVQTRRPQCTALKEDAQAKNRASKEAEAYYHRCRTNLKLLEKDNEQLTKRIEELRHSINQSSEADRVERFERIKSLQEGLKELKDQDATVSQQMDQFQQAITKYKEELYKLRREEQDVRNTTESRKRQLSSLKASRTDRVKRFGEHMPAILSDINEAYRQGRFVKKPVGPLGYCIRLKDPELALAVESCLKGNMQAFCCDNYKDEKTLQSVMSRYYTHGKRPQIIVSEFTHELYNIRDRAVNHPEFPSVLQALEIDDPVVANCLIDMRGIETILLIKDNSVARRVMQCGNPPRNCREAFTRDGDQVYSNRYYSADYRRAQYLSGDVEAEISHLEDEIENRMAQVKMVQDQLRALEDDIKQNEALLRRKHDNRKQAKDKMRRIELEIGDLQNIEEPQSVDISTLEEESQDICIKINAAKQDAENARKKMDEHRKVFEEAEHKYKEFKEQINLITEEADPLKEELSKTDCEVEKSKHHKRHYEEKRKSHLDGIKRLKADLEAKENELQASFKQAKEICQERLEVRRSAKSLDTEMNRLRDKINTEQDQQGNREEIVRQYHEAVQKYKEIALQVKNLKKFIVLLGKIMQDRHKAYVKLRTYLSVRCKYYFDSLLLQRGYSGKMTFDHKNETLAIAVQPGEGDKAALNDMRSLSGGERSFSTICFILSLWAIAEAPFRCLDEFDVYMDMVNRRISMDMMLKVADSQRYRQFIFLTPQSMSSLPVSSLIRILRMHDPERGQTVLPFQTRNQEEDEDQ